LTSTLTTLPSLRIFKRWWTTLINFSFSYLDTSKNQDVYARCNLQLSLLANFRLESRVCSKHALSLLYLYIFVTSLLV
jgi:hypothetical protein